MAHHDVKADSHTHSTRHPENLFVHGPLEFPEVWQALVGHAPIRLHHAHLSDHKSHGIRGKSYPAVTVNQSGTVVGRFVFDIGVPERQRIVKFFEQEFELKNVVVQLKDSGRKPVHGRALIWKDKDNPHKNDIGGKSWDLMDFEENDMQRFLAECAHARQKHDSSHKSDEIRKKFDDIMKSAANTANKRRRTEQLQSLIQYGREEGLPRDDPKLQEAEALIAELEEDVHHPTRSEILAKEPPGDHWDGGKLRSAALLRQEDDLMDALEEFIETKESETVDQGKQKELASKVWKEIDKIGGSTGKMDPGDINEIVRLYLSRQVLGLVISHPLAKAIEEDSHDIDVSNSPRSLDDLKRLCHRAAVASCRDIAHHLPDISYQLWHELSDGKAEIDGDQVIANLGHATDVAIDAALRPRAEEHTWELLHAGALHAGTADDCTHLVQAYRKKQHEVLAESRNDDDDCCTGGGCHIA